MKSLEQERTAMSSVTLALDIGGSSVKVGLFSSETFASSRALSQRFGEVQILGRAFTDVKNAVFAAVSSALNVGPSFESVAISTTGSVDASGVVISAGHYTGYERIDWSQLLLPVFPAIKRVRVFNDGKASAWAEYRYLRGGATASHVHFVIGTGVGSSVIVSGKLIDGDSGEAGFLGHTRVTEEETTICSCDLQGCLETVASGPGLVHEFNKKSPQSINDFDDFKNRLSEGDAYATEVLKAACRHFGTVSAILVNGLNPRNITFGGGVVLGIRSAFAKLGDEEWFLRHVREKVAHDAFYRSANTTTLCFGSLDNDGGLIGAALLAAER